MSPPLLSFSGVSKAFDGIYALRDVSFDVAEGECLALVGENGAGKSTLMKVLSGVWPHGSFDGQVRFDGRSLKLRSPLEGRRAGISIIHQELCLFPKLTVAENLFLTETFPYEGRPSQQLFRRVHWQSLFAKARSLFSELGFDVEADAFVEELSVAKRQLVEIARAFHHKAKLLILDEPTSALSKAEVKHLFDIVARMKRRMTFIYISHKLDEVFRLADRIVVLRDGHAVSHLNPSETTEDEVVRHMVGRRLRVSAHVQRELSGDPILEVRGLTHSSPRGKRLLSDVSFSLRRGEVLGIAGLMGAGRSELLRSILGVLPGKREGKVFFKGQEVRWAGTRDAMTDGVAFVPEDRKKDGLFLDHSVAFNLTVSVLGKLIGALGKLNGTIEKAMVGDLARRMGIKASRFENPVRVLSGGNQQKVLLGKVVARSPDVIFLDEPTRGIDVGAKEEIYQIIRGLAAEGLSIVLVSSELPEILSLSDRVIVLREGRVKGELQNVRLGQEDIMRFAAGAGGRDDGGKNAGRIH